MVRALLLGALGLALALLAACGQGEEDLLATRPAETPTAAPAQATPSPTQPHGGAGGELGPATVVPAPTSSASPAPIPADWATYTNSDILAFTLRYPAGWFIGPGKATISSWDPAAWDKPWYPPGGFRLQLDIAPTGQAEPRPPAATDLTLAGVAGWEIIYAYDRPTPTGITRVHQVAIDRDGMRLFLIGYFAQETPDEETFARLLSSFTFLK